MIIRTFGGNRNAARNKYIRHPSVETALQKSETYTPVPPSRLQRICAIQTRQELNSLLAEIAADTSGRASPKTKRRWAEALAARTIILGMEEQLAEINKGK